MVEKRNELNEKIQEVAERIRAAREDTGLSMAQMAKELEMTTEEYAMYETGIQDFSFTFIYKFANVCGLEITDIMEGTSPSLKGFTVTRKGQGTPIVRREGFVYNRLAPLFKDKIAEPFHVVVPYSEEALSGPLHMATHKGQELDIVIKGTVKIYIGENSVTLNEGDSVYYDSSIPHDEVALNGKDCELYAIVMNSEKEDDFRVEDYVSNRVSTFTDSAKLKQPVYEKFISTKCDEQGVLTDIKFKNCEKFNFAYDVVDAIAEKSPYKTAMIYISKNHEEKKITFEDMAKHTNMTANYFKSLGIKKGDKVMLVLKRHYQFWYSILALHKIGAVVIPATSQLLEHDFEYRFRAGNVKAIVCTADGETASQAEIAMQKVDVPIKVIVNGLREGWSCFDKEYKKFSQEFDRPSGEEDTSVNDTMLMFFTSGTTGYPKIACHTFGYPLGHFITAKYWHNVDPNGLHFTIAETGWGKALWGKLYGQWLCEAGVFVYDFDKFVADDILNIIGQYGITTFCAPPTMYRFFIKEDLSNYDLSSIKYATTAGEALNPEVYNQFLRATGIKIMEGFGQTETTLTICNLVGQTNKIGSMGKPSPLYDVCILNENGEIARVGEVGEICVKTSENVPFGLFSEYYNDEEKTKAVWHDGYYHTGDTAYKDESGYFWYVGRNDDVIKSSGYRIGPFEIESVIMELPYVLECAVTPVPDPVRGQVVKATIVLTKNAEPSEDLKKEIQMYVKKHTAPYKYPRVVEFVEALPKTISGKIRRVELK